MIHSGPEQAVVNLARIGLIDRFPLEESFDDDKQVVENRDAQSQHGDEQREYGRLLESPVQRDDGENKAQERCARIAHEYSGRRFVVPQIGQGHTDQRHRQHGRRGLPFGKGDNEQRSGGNGGQTARQTVKPVRKINDRGYSKNPQDGQNKLQPSRQQDVFAVKRVDESAESDTGEEHQYSCGYLDDQLGKRRKILALCFEPIVDRADGQQQDTAQKKSAGFPSELPGKQKIRRKETDEDRVAGGQRNRVPVYFALDILTGFIHKVQAEGEFAEGWNQNIYN
ncbi:hypothetical protein D1872_238630 [compost metagenome]